MALISTVICRAAQQLAFEYGGMLYVTLLNIQGEGSKGQMSYVKLLIIQGVQRSNGLC